MTKNLKEEDLQMTNDHIQSPDIIWIRVLPAFPTMKPGTLYILVTTAFLGHDWQIVGVARVLDRGQTRILHTAGGEGCTHPHASTAPQQNTLAGSGRPVGWCS